MLIDIAEAEAKCDQRNRGYPEGPIGPIQKHATILQHFSHFENGRTATAARLFALTPTTSRCWPPPRGRCLIAPANSSRAFSRYSPERIRDALLSFGRFRHCLRDIPPQRPHADSNTDKRWGLTVAEAGSVLSVLMRPVVQEPRAVDRQHGAFFLQGQIVRWSGLADVST